ncbi:MAG: hypothetical protein II752_07740 [Muribaculaceae bacterium]|nr:hypothetical protein [Muribaculaceae bacterium]
MKKFVLKITLLFVIIGICDFTFGVVMNHVVGRISIGSQGRDNFICNQVKEDVLVFGSSRAAHHYNAQMLEDSLGMTCYNCGDDGNGIILSYGRLLMIKERKAPKIVIHDISAQFDLFKNDNGKYLGWLKPRYEREGIRDIFDMVDKTEKYKMLSQMYRHNSKFLQNLVVYLSSKSSDTGIKGYRPINSAYDPMKFNKNKMAITKRKYDFDPLKLGFTNKFIDLAGDAKVLFIVSPMWYGSDSTQFAPIKEICHRRGVLFLDYSNNPKYVHKEEYFKDGYHLNAKGADEFTKDLIKVLKSQIDFPSQSKQ